MCAAPLRCPAQTIGIPSGVVRPEALWNRRWGPVLAGDLLVDPSVRLVQTLPQSDPGLPAEHPADAGVVGVATAHALRSSAVAQREVGLAGDLDDRLRQLVDGDQLACPDVERLPVVRPHQAVDALDAVVDVAERAGLPAVPPDLDLVAGLGQGDLAAHGRRSLLAAAVIGAVRPVDVVEARDPGHHPELVRVVAAE